MNIFMTITLGEWLGWSPCRGGPVAGWTWVRARWREQPLCWKNVCGALCAGVTRCEGVCAWQRAPVVVLRLNRRG